MVMKASLEMKMEVWNDSTRECIEVAEDSDGLGMVQIRFVSDDGKKGPDIRWPREHTPLILEAIKRVSDFIQENEEGRGRYTVEGSD